MKRKRSPRPLILLAIEGATKAAMETKQQGFDVFASPEGVHRKIGARAEVFKQARTAHCHPILPSACRSHHVVTISLSDRARKNILDRLPGTLLPRGNLLLDDGDLFLDDHIEPPGMANRQDSRNHGIA